MHAALFCFPNYQVLPFFQELQYILFDEFSIYRYDPCVLKEKQNWKIKSTECTLTALLVILEVMQAP